MENCLRLAAIRGIQVGQAFYVSMLPFGMVGRFFAGPPSPAGGRPLNKGRLSAIMEFLDHRTSGFVVPPVHVSVEGELRFEAATDQRSAGILEINLDASIEIIDGQHRIAAIKTGIRMRRLPTRETLPVCIYAAAGEEAAAQMFDTLNRRLVKPPRPPEK